MGNESVTDDTLSDQAMMYSQQYEIWRREEVESKIEARFSGWIANYTNTVKSAQRKLEWEQQANRSLILPPVSEALEAWVSKHAQKISATHMRLFSSKFG